MKKSTTNPIKEEAMAESGSAQPDHVPSTTPDDSTTQSSQQAADVLQDPALLSALLGDMPDEAISGADMEPYNENNDDDDDDDEVVREIDVFLSPQLATKMNLVQFPLQPSSLACPEPLVPQKQNQRRKISSLPRGPPPQVPVAARIKPQHSILELDYKIHTSAFSSQHSVPEVLNLPQRTYRSEQVPMATHMALGLFDKTGTRIDLVPLHRTLQMRPSFQHVDALYDDEDDEHKIAEEKKKQQEKAKDGKPIMFQKPESERTVQQRLNSYAYKKSSEEGEEWTDLEIYGPGSEERREAVKQCHCPKDRRTTNLQFLLNGETSRDANTGYVKSLNYLPHSQAIMGDGEGGGGGGRLGSVAEEDFRQYTVTDEDGQVNSEAWKKELTERVSNLLQGRGGVPIPYPVIRSRYHPSVPDEVLMEAISASAAVVRGNFLVKSTLLGLTNPHIMKARDFILVLLNKYGFVQREKLSHVYQSLDDTDGAKNDITSEVLDSLLNMVGRKTTNGFEMKVDDDPTFAAYFPDISRAHVKFWERKETFLAKYVSLYEDQMEDTTMH